MIKAATRATKEPWHRAAATEIFGHARKHGSGSFGENAGQSTGFYNDTEYLTTLGASNVAARPYARLEIFSGNSGEHEHGILDVHLDGSLVHRVIDSNDRRRVLSTVVIPKIKELTRAQIGVTFSARELAKVVARAKQAHVVLNKFAPKEE